MTWKKRIMAPFDLYELSNARPFLMGIATLLIVFYHSQYLDLFSSAFLTKTRLLGIVTRIHRTANSGVDLFVLLCGFGLFFSYSSLLEKTEHPLKAFYHRRYGKILPTVLLMNILTYGILGTEGAVDWQRKVFLYGAFIPGEGECFWFFSFLAVLYLIYPLIHHVIAGKHSVSGAAGLASLSVAAAIILNEVDSEYFHSWMQLMLSRMPAFIAGACLGRFSREHRRIPAAVPIAAIPLYLLLLILLADAPQSFYDIRFFAYCCPVLMIALSNAWLLAVIRKRHFLSKLITLIGSYSMEIYLIYESLYYHAVGLFSVRDTTGMLYVITVLTATVMLSVILRATVSQLTASFRNQRSQVRTKEQPIAGA